jgi:hypothetical protein
MSGELSPTTYELVAGELSAGTRKNINQVVNLALTKQVRFG